MVRAGRAASAVPVALDARARWNCGRAPRATTPSYRPAADAATGSRGARRWPPASASGRSSSASGRLSATPRSTRRSTGASGTRPGFTPTSSRSLEEFERGSGRQQVRTCATAQARTPPFGDYLCVPRREVYHIHGTSGTTGRPTAFGIGRADWDAIANAHARVMWGDGHPARRHGRSSRRSSASTWARWGALAGAERLGARRFPSAPARRA